MYSVTRKSSDILRRYSCFRIEEGKTEAGAVASKLRVRIANYRCQIELIYRWQGEMDDVCRKRSELTLRQIHESIGILERELDRALDRERI